MTRTTLSKLLFVHLTAILCAFAAAITGRAEEDRQVFGSKPEAGGTREDAILERIRYTGEPVYLPWAVNLTPEGVRLTFSQPPEPALAKQVETEMTDAVASWLDPESDPDDRPDWFIQGRESFEMNCLTCHQPGGVAPAMVDSRWAGESPEVVGRILLQGMEGRRGLMTSFDWMDDDELAAVLSYIRARWFGKHPFNAATITLLREETADRDDFWTADELQEFIDED